MTDSFSDYATKYNWALNQVKKSFPLRILFSGLSAIYMIQIEFICYKGIIHYIITYIAIMRLSTSIIYFISLLIIHSKAFKAIFMGGVRIDDISWLQILFLRLCNPRGKTLFIWCFLSKANTNKAFSFIFYFLKSNILFYLAMKFMSLQSDGTQRTITQFKTWNNFIYQRCPHLWRKKYREI